MDAGQQRLGKVEQFLWVNLIILALSLIFSLGIAQIVLVLLALGYGYRLYLLPVRLLKLSYLDWAVLLFFATRLISIPVSIDMAVSAGSLKKTVFFVITYSIISRLLADANHQRLLRFFQYLLIAAIAVSFYGTGKYLFGLEERVRSTVSGYTTLAIFLSALFSLALGAGMYFKLLKNKWYWLGALVVMLICLALTFARAQWLATFFVILVVGAMKNRKIIIAAFAIVILMILISPNIRNRVATLANPVKHSSERTIIWQGAAEVFPDRFWFGHGIGSFHHIFPFKEQMKDQKIGRWHNDYLQVLMESGLFGLLIFLHLIFAIYRTGWQKWRRFRRQNNMVRQGLLFGILLALLTFFIQGVASGFIGDPISSILFWLLVGSLAAV